MGMSFFDHIRTVFNHRWVDPAEMKILEPCAGIGNLIYHMLPWVYNGAQVDAYELNDFNYKYGEKLFPEANWTWGEVFGFLLEIESQYDLVVCNPPFGITWGTGSAKENCISGATKSQHFFLEAAAIALKPDGVAAFIAPYNYLESMPKKMGKWYEDNFELIDQVDKLPGQFALTSISVGSYIFRCKKVAPLPPDNDLIMLQDFQQLSLL